MITLEDFDDSHERLPFENVNEQVINGLIVCRTKKLIPRFLKELKQIAQKPAYYGQSLNNIITYLIAFNEKRAFDSLIKILGWVKNGIHPDHTSIVKHIKTASWALGVLGDERAVPHLKKVTEILVDRYISFDRIYNYEAIRAIRILSKEKAIVSLLLNVQQAEDWRAIEQASYELLQLGGPVVKKIRFLEEASQRRKLMEPDILPALGYLIEEGGEQGEEAVKALLVIFENPKYGDYDYDYRLKIMALLGNIGNDLATKTLLKLPGYGGYFFEGRSRSYVEYIKQLEKILIHGTISDNLKDEIIQRLINWKAWWSLRKFLPIQDFLCIIQEEFTNKKNSLLIKKEAIRTLLKYYIEIDSQGEQLIISFFQNLLQKNKNNSSLIEMISKELLSFETNDELERLIQNLPIIKESLSNNKSSK